MEHTKTKRGRPRKDATQESKVVSSSISLYPSEWGKVDALKGSQSRSDYFRSIIQKELDPKP